MNSSHENAENLGVDTRVVVVGMGYVGLPLALLVAEKGYEVVGIDIDPAKIEKLKKHHSPIEDRYIYERISDTSAAFSDSYSTMSHADIVVVCVPTPVRKNHAPDLDPVRAAMRSVGEHLSQGQLVILESTVNPGVSENIVIPLLESQSGLAVGADFGFAHCPERINPGDESWTVENIPRVVGASDADALDRAVAFYETIISGEVKPMSSLKEAEAVKVVENAFRDINIAFVNELARSFSKLGIDVVNVIDGAATKPFAFMAHYPGCGVGGHCIPVDPYYLIRYAEENGFDHKFLKLAREINNDMPVFTVNQLEQGLKKAGLQIKDAQVAVLGLAYKRNIDDDRESPSYHIIEQVKKRGGKVRIYDPHIPSRSTVTDLTDALDGADAIVIATDHKEFMEELSPEMLREKGVRVIIDGRNALDGVSFAAQGMVYVGIGRHQYSSEAAASLRSEHILKTKSSYE